MLTDLEDNRLSERSQILHDSAHMKGQSQADQCISGRLRVPGVEVGMWVGNFVGLVKVF